MPRKITTYTLDHPTDPELDAQLKAVGAFTDEGLAQEALQSFMGWDEIFFSNMKQLDRETAFFGAASSADAAAVGDTGPRLLQRNVEV